jgi:putative Holliday junction resolvase
VAVNQETLPTHKLYSFIKEKIHRDTVNPIVVGLPTQLNGEPSESMKYITPFVKRLGKELPGVPLVMYDERFTSTIAHQAMIDGGMKKSDRRDKSRVDAIAATIILNDYLQSIYNQPES